MKLGTFLWLPYCLKAFKYANDPATTALVNAHADALKELALAFPLVLQNLTNCTGIIRNGNEMLDRSVITYHPGKFQLDEEFVVDKTAGYYAVLHDFLAYEFGEGQAMQFCAPGLVPNIMPCLRVGACLLQAAVPEHVDIELYAGMLEQLTRFEEIMWPILRDSLVHEEGGNVLADDISLPDSLSCDDSAHDSSLLQLTATADAQHAEAMATAAALHKATVDSHRVLDAHGLNSSMDATINKLQQS
ncbi:unnamed protein product [Symbiodinium sp. CCMP2592]|nr:unnamed protein product [Symbiodinium sp. CCMP2592]